MKLYAIRNCYGDVRYITNDYEYAKKFIEYIRPDASIKEFDSDKVCEMVDPVIEKYNGKKLYKCTREPHFPIVVKNEGISDDDINNDMFSVNGGTAIGHIFANDREEAEKKFRKMMNDYIEEEKMVAEFRKQLREKRRMKNESICD